MAEPTVLPLDVRSATGKGAARAARRAGFVPGIVYGDKQDPINVQMRENELHKAINRGRFFSTLIELEVAGERFRAIPRDMQMDVVRDLPVHVDFLRLSPRSEITLMIPMTFINEEESPGIKRGGVLNIVRHEVELRVRAADIPETLVADLTGLEIGDVVHISSVQLPEGAKLTITDRDFAVATVASPSALAAEIREEQEAAQAEAEAEGEAPAEGEEAAPEGEAEKPSEGSES